MSYPPPPGLKPSTTPSSSLSPNPPAHSSLPPRPPPAAGTQPPFKSTNFSTPTFSSAPGTRGYNGPSQRPANQPANAFSGFMAFQPRSVATNNQAFRPVVSAAPAPPTGFTAPQTTYSSGPYQASASYQQPPVQSYGQESYPEPTPPQIRNPFPLPGQGGAGAAQGSGRGPEIIDPEMEAQIAQWQSAYAGKDANSSSGGARTFSRFGMSGEGSVTSTGANTAPLGARPDAMSAPLSNSAIVSATNADTGVAAVVTGADGKQKTVVRSGGGQTWQDPSLLEWDPAHFRLFVGNLAGEVTDESLLKAFAKYASVQKARVVRDKRIPSRERYAGKVYWQSSCALEKEYNRN